MSRRVLVVCTANVCRSPMAAGLLQRSLDARGYSVAVTSAGTRLSGLPVDPVAVAADADLGVDISGHVPRQLDRGIVDGDGADLVITMTREHLRVAATSSRNAFGRVFTLRELVRRAEQAAMNRPRGAIASTSWQAWIEALAVGRHARDLMGDDSQDDIADPYGLGRGKVGATADELDRLIRRLVDLAPW